MAIARYLTANADLSILGVFAFQRAFGVIKDQIDAGFTDRLTLGGTIEDDVGHGVAAQVLGRTFPHHPAHGINRIRFTAAIRADDTGQVGIKGNGRRVNKGFEPRQSDSFQAHGSNGVLNPGLHETSEAFLRLSLPYRPAQTANGGKQKRKE